MAGRHEYGRFSHLRGRLPTPCRTRSDDRRSGLPLEDSRLIDGLYLTGGDYAMSVVYIGVLDGLKANCDNEKVRAFLNPVTRKQFDGLAY